jgi:hypothetical protein
MFEKRDFRMYEGVSKSQIYPEICDFWARQGFCVAQLSQFNIHGQSYHQKIGLRREFTLWIYEEGGKIYINLQLQARITDEGLVGGAAAAVIFWPVAVVGGALSYSEYEQEAKNLMASFWNHMNQITGKSSVPVQSPPPPPSVPQPSQETVPCQGCGALLPKTWRACPYCGRGSG